MNAMAPTRPTGLNGCRVRLTTGPAAAAEARSQVRAVICAWDVPVDLGVAVLLTSELVTNAIRHEPGETVMLVISCSRGQLRVDVHDTSRSLPVLQDVAADAEAGRGLMLVATLSAEWGVYRTPAGKAVYFTLGFEPDSPIAANAARGPHPGGRGVVHPPSPTVPAETAGDPRIALTSVRWCAARIRGLCRFVSARQLLQDVGDVGRDGPPGEQQLGCDLRVGQSLLDEPGDLDLGRREAVPAAARPPVLGVRPAPDAVGAERRLPPGDVRGRAERGVGLTARSERGPRWARSSASTKYPAAASGAFALSGGRPASS